MILCEKAGFDYIEIRLDMLQEYLRTHTIDQLKDFFANSRLKPHAFNALYIYQELFSPGDFPQRKKEIMRQFMLGCKVGREIGAHYFIVVTPMLPAPSDEAYPSSEEKVREDCVRILNHLIAIAREYGIKLCFEPVGFSRCAVRNIRQANAIIRAMECPDVGFAFDSYNLFVDGGLRNFDEMKQVQKEKLFAVHINNADSLSPARWGQETRRFCDEGMLNLPNFLKNLREMGYDGMVSIEVFRPEYWALRPEEVIERAYKTTYECLKQNGCL